jgi:hypothetical protein
VATDQKINLIDAGTDQIGSVIENELPAYRAISRLAVFSLIFGFLALFSFAHWFFYLFAILAILAGIAANVTVKRYSDILTGRGLASAGIAMGLIFGLASGTIATVQGYVRNREAERFAKKLAVTLKAPSAGDALWWSAYPDMRKDKSPTQYLQEVEARKGKERMMFDQKMGPFNKIRGRLTAAEGEDIHFVKIESTGLDEGHGLELGIYALAVFELEGPGSKEFPEKQQFAAALIKAKPKGKQYDWWVEDYIFPYKPSSFVPAEKPVDDGHGHAH